MRRVLALVAVLLAYVPLDARAEGAPSALAPPAAAAPPSAPAPAAAGPASPPTPAPTAAPPAAPAPADIPQTTAVHGTLPDLTGRWLVLFDLNTNAVTRTIPLLLDIASKDGKLEVVERFSDLPAALAQALDRYNREQVPWEPTAAEVTALAEQWPELPLVARGITGVTTDLWEPSAFDETMRKRQASMKDAIWVMRETSTFAPGGQRPNMQINVLTATARDGSGWRGDGTLAQLVTAPFPVPISLDGTFRMLRVEVRPGATGLLARILDAFKGCGG